MAPNKHKAESASESSSLTSWVAPTLNEFNALKRYKSCLIPPGNTHAVGQFVWLAHEEGPRPSKRLKQTISQTGSDANGGGEKQSDPRKLAAEEWLRLNEDDNERWEAGYWLGQIIEIRAKDTNNVWMKIRWLCRTLNELKAYDVKSGLPKSHPGGREVFMLGPQADDIQPVGAIEGAAQVVVFDERNPLQAPISPKAIFYRSEARIPTKAEATSLLPKSDTKKSQTKKKSRPSTAGGSVFEPGHLFPLRRPTCYCDQPYRPLSSREEGMAMCSNAGCYKWFHHGCLDWKKDYRRTATSELLEHIQSSGVELMELLPAYGEVTPAQVLSFDTNIEDFTPSNGERTDGSSTSQTAVIKTAIANGSVKEKAEDGSEDGQIAVNNEDGAGNGDATLVASGSVKETVQDRSTPKATAELDSNLPEGILRAARFAVTRGTEATGVVGNARAILRARQIVTTNRMVRSSADTEGKSKSRVAHEGDSTTVVETAQRVAELVKQWEAIHLWNEQDMLPAREVVWICPSCTKPM